MGCCICPRTHELLIHVFLLYANHIHVQMYFQRENGQISLLSKTRSSNNLAQFLPSLVLRVKAVSTVKKYSGAYNRWGRWASMKPEIKSTLPPLPLHICLYLSFLAQTAKTSAPIVEAVNALSWVNQIETVENTMSHPLVIQVLAGIKRKLAYPTVKKEPITPEILSTLVSKFGQQDASLSDIRTLCVCLLGFAGFF